MAFLLASLGFSGLANANVPLWAPAVSLSLALDWNQLAVDAIRRPRPKAPARARRHVVPKLTVTAAAPAPAQLDVAAYGRAEHLVRQAIVPSYVEPDPDRRQMFRQLYVMPYAPYVGAMGFVMTIETNALLR